VNYTTIDIERDEAAAEMVASVNGGNRTVPTVVLPGGDTLTNPPIKVLLDRLSATA
jgi:mycoredoxin